MRDTVVCGACNLRKGVFTANICYQQLVLIRSGKVGSTLRI